ncbi:MULTISPECIES: class E sortase [Streptomyces]|uniref:Class E sortase n=1 Tax=Streptomyces dengpaensis TaxID=2049881 RepID=A0ABM6SVJ3_9ACTN|nr:MULTISPECIES: class E sortase [Streptomyces]AVH58538.1 class E sortase [Streptomyces dengpaensis]PIB04987.1 class E sortase [Streptomyces sp. HG99]
MRAPGIVHHGTRRRRAAYRRAVWSGAEALVTVGVVLLLLVVHQLWWTNRQAQHNAERKVLALEREWGSPSVAEGVNGEESAGSSDGSDGREASSPTGQRRQGETTGTTDTTGTPRARPDLSQAYAILTIPRLSLRVPVAEGISKPSVLNKGYVGHYQGTQQPGQAGNFAVAGHRNTHGEPFRYINRLRRGDTITVETKGAVYTYAVDKTLPQTSAGDGGVIRSVPRSGVRPSYGYGEPAYYITLTTCTPEYSSKYRLVVWGKLRSMRPR